MTTEAKRPSPKLTAEQCKTIHDEAHKAGQEAADKMETWFGCGFSWVIIRPGNGAYANWLKKNGLANKSQYYGGVMLYVTHYGQNANKKYAYSQAYASVLANHNITAYADSRAD